MCDVLTQMNAADTLGQTALHRAALAGHLQTCRLLLSYGADPAVVSLQGFTAAQMGNEAVQQILNGKHDHPAHSPRMMRGCHRLVNMHNSIYLLCRKHSSEELGCRLQAFRGS